MQHLSHFIIMLNVVWKSNCIQNWLLIQSHTGCLDTTRFREMCTSFVYRTVADGDLLIKNRIYNKNHHQSDQSDQSMYLHVRKNQIVLAHQHNMVLCIIFCVLYMRTWLCRDMSWYVLINNGMILISRKWWML